MAEYGRVTALTMVAGSDLRSRLYHVLRKAGQSGQLPIVDVASNGGGGEDEVYGLLWTKGDSGRAVAVATDGEAIVVAGAAITAGERLTCNGSGRAVMANSGDWTFATAQQTCTQDGEHIRCLLQLPSVRLTF